MNSGAAGQLAGRAGQLGKIPLGQEAVADVAQVDPRAGAEHAQDQLVGGHFQAEHAHRHLQLQRHVLGDVHGQRGFAHRRPRRDDDHFALMQAGGHFVEIGKAGGNAGQHALVGVIFLDFGDGVVDQFLDRRAGAGDPLLADAQNVALHFVQQRIHLPFVIENAARQCRCRFGSFCAADIFPGRCPGNTRDWPPKGRRRAEADK